MKRLRLALLPAAVVFAVGWPMWSGIGADGLREAGLCADMTPARMLEDPALAHEWAQALRSSHPGEVERVKALLEQIRAAHGCQGELAMPDAEPRLPPGHPPVPEAEPGLPPGHPPIPSAPWPTSFGTSGIVTI